MAAWNFVRKHLVSTAAFAAFAGLFAEWNQMSDLKLPISQSIAGFVFLESILVVTIILYMHEQQTSLRRWWWLSFVPPFVLAVIVYGPIKDRIDREQRVVSHAEEPSTPQHTDANEIAASRPHSAIELAVSAAPLPIPPAQSTVTPPSIEGIQNGKFSSRKKKREVSGIGAPVFNVSSQNQQGGITAGIYNAAPVPPLPKFTVTHRHDPSGPLGILETIEVEPIGRQFNPTVIAVLKAEQEFVDFHSISIRRSGNVDGAMVTTEFLNFTSESPDGHLVGVSIRTFVPSGDGQSVYLKIRRPITRLWIGEWAGKQMQIFPVLRN